MQTRQYYVYLLTNFANTVIYTGVTNNLGRRVFEHKNKQALGFTAKYNINKLVYYEITNDINEALKREKQLKAGSRKKKIELIEKMNKSWDDLYLTIL
jgi:putative endonuclease